MEAAAAFLSLRPRSMAETRARLRRLGYPDTLTDVVVERLAHVGYLDDLAFARWWVESRDRARPRGVMALRAELLRKGVPREAVDDVLADRSERSAGPTPRAGTEETGSADVAAAHRLLARREAALSREADPRRRRQKAYALLARHGFTPDVCREVAARFAATDGPVDEEAGTLEGHV
jgi:regulatory protein